MEDTLFAEDAAGRGLPNAPVRELMPLKGLAVLLLCACTLGIIKSRTEHIDREKLKNIFGLNNRDLRAVFEKLRLKALDSGRLEFADRLRL